MVEINMLSFWPFTRHHQVVTDSQTEHRIDFSLNEDGVCYHATPYLQDWTTQWSSFIQDQPLLGLLNQLEDLGYITASDDRFFLSWEALYQFLASPNGNDSGLLSVLKLPQLSDYRPGLVSDGSLEDLEFRITLGEWSDNNGVKLAVAPKVEGAVIRTQTQSFLLEESVWRLVHEVRAFYALAREQRSPQINRQYWSHIRRYACIAHVPMEDFLQRTVVLSPDKLMLHLHQSLVHGKKTVQVEPDFADAPPQWLTTFDKFKCIPERYDIPDGQGIVQILVLPQVRSVLQEIRRWPGRYVSGQRAEAFIRNPYAALGDDAIAVIDENQFEVARVEAGIDFERFVVDVEYLDSGKVQGVALLIESTSVQNKPGSRFEFENPEQLGEFIALFEKKSQRWTAVCTLESL